MFLGLDLGTTNIKAVVVDDTGDALASGSAPVEIFHLDNGGVEQDIEQIWLATLDAITQATSSGIGPKVQAVGVSSQGGAIQIQTENRRPQGCVISWMDGRGKPYDAKLIAELGSDWFAAHLGHGGCGMTPGQVLRLRKENLLPEGFRVGFVGDVIVSRLCGLAAHDASSLSLGMLYNPSLGRADPELLDKIGLKESHLPKLLAARTPAGGLLGEVARETSLPAGIAVSAAIHDQYAAALGCGAVNAGDVMFGAGTAWVLLAVTDKLTGPVVNSACECRHVVDGLYGQILSMANGGSSLSWVLNTLGLDDIEPEQLDKLIKSVPPGSNGLVFWPLLVQGDREGLPKETAGQMTGLRLSHTKAHIVRAVIEGLACELTRHLNILSESGLGIRTLIMAGHAASSGVTPRIIADISNLPVLCAEAPAVSAIGAATIALGLVEPDKDIAELARSVATRRGAVEPATNNVVAYRPLLEKYRARFISPISETI
jgi:xylulokinase